jgi:hypothetical protein
MKRNTKILIQVGLALLIVAMGILFAESILEPIRFKKEKDYRYNVTVLKLKDIRTAQLAYKDVYKHFTGSFDTLINFVKYDSLPLIFKKGEIPEELLGKITELEAVKKGMIVRDTIRISVIDSLFSKNYPIDSIRYIPFSNGKEFKMAQGEIITGSKLKVKVFEAKALSDYILTGLDPQSIINLNDGRTAGGDGNEYRGLMVGSMVEANNSAGNWE